MLELSRAFTAVSFWEKTASETNNGVINPSKNTLSVDLISQIQNEILLYYIWNT